MCGRRACIYSFGYEQSAYSKGHTVVAIYSSRMEALNERKLWINQKPHVKCVPKKFVK